MGSFNRLITKIVCSNCKGEFEAAIQFKFGHTWQMQHVLGDEIKWGGNDNGESGNAVVMVYGIAENNICSSCGFANKEEFDILIKDNVISRVSTMVSVDKYNEASNDNFYIVK